MKKILLLFYVISLTAFLQAQTPAFPGAEGGGMYTTGGRQGTVYYVNNLSDDNVGNISTNEGSLRWCLGRQGVRTILFKVSGTITLTKELKISNGNVTIAGQSAPGDGVCIAGYPVSIGADNIIMRYLRIRMGDEKISVGAADGADALGGRFFNNVIIDHCSMSWSTDECASLYNANNFTLQWSIISESLRLSKHDKGPHGYGGIWGGTNSSFHHNLMAHNDSRNPRIGPNPDGKPLTETMDMRNNVIYNWCGNSTYGGEAMFVNLVNNYYKPGPATPTGSKRGRIFSADKKTETNSSLYDVWGKYYVDGNVVEDGTEKNTVNATKDNWNYGVYNQFSASYGTVSSADKAAMKLAEPVEMRFVSTHTAYDAYEKVMEYAGASYKRDSYDERVINETRTRTATYKGLSVYNGYGSNYPGSSVDWKSKNYPQPGIIDSQSDLKPADADDTWSAWPVLKQGAEIIDTNRDGISDGWLEANGYAGKLATDLNEAGYSYLEVYLNSLVSEITTNQNQGTINGIDVSADDSSEKNISAYYNSNTNQLIVNAKAEISKIYCSNLSGMLIRGVAANYNKSASVDMSGIDRGIYIIRVLLNDKTYSVTKIVL